MKIVIGSSSDQKNKYLKEVLGELKVEDFNITSVEVSSEVNDQPLSSEETLKGSIERARSAYMLQPNSEISLGIEVGYESNSNQKYEMFCWTTIFDGKKEYSSKSNHFILPEFHQEIIKSGKYLGDYVRNFYNENDSVYKKLLGDLIIKRDVIIKNSIFHSLAYYLNKSDYQTF
jgi:non-canonical (house-cleaning) NTP pyrophosphatase